MKTKRPSPSVVAARDARVAGATRRTVALRTGCDASPLIRRPAMTAVPVGAAARLKMLGYVLDAVWKLRNQDRIRAAGDTCAESNPTCVPSHHLNDHQAPMSFSS